MSLFPHQEDDSPQPERRAPSLNEQDLPETLPDEVFIRRALSDNPEQGMELLFLRYYQPLCTHAVKFVRCRQVAEDIVSDIFYGFYTKRLYEQINSSFRSYLFAAVRNRGHNYLRWELGKNSSLDDSSPYDVPDFQQPDSITQYEELYQDVEKAIEELPVKRRFIYLQFQFEGKSIKEIAGELLVSTRTIETQIYRARQAVRDRIRDKWFLSLLIFAILSI